MNRQINETTVTIRGTDYQIRGDAEPQHIQRLAAFVDDRMRALEESARPATAAGANSTAESAGPRVPPARLAILASLMIADELFQERARIGRDDGDMTLRLERLRLELDETIGSPPPGAGGN